MARRFTSIPSQCFRRLLGRPDEPHYDQILVGTTRAGGAWRPDLWPSRSSLRLFRNRVVFRKAGKQSGFGTVARKIGLAIDPAAMRHRRVSHPPESGRNVTHRADREAGENT